MGDGNLFYPDRDGGVLASTRLANLRDGIEDYEYFAMLKKLVPNHKLLTVPDDITTLNTGVYTRDGSKLNARRKAVAEAIEKLTAGTGSHGLPAF